MLTKYQTFVYRAQREIEFNITQDDLVGSESIKNTPPASSKDRTSGPFRCLGRSIYYSHRVPRGNAYTELPLY